MTIAVYSRIAPFFSILVHNIQELRDVHKKVNIFSNVKFEVDLTSVDRFLDSNCSTWTRNHFRKTREIHSQHTRVVPFSELLELPSPMMDFLDNELHSGLEINFARVAFTAGCVHRTIHVGFSNPGQFRGMPGMVSKRTYTEFLQDQHFFLKMAALTHELHDMQLSNGVVNPYSNHAGPPSTWEWPKNKCHRITYK